ncbi:MAG: DmsE family decaheme c-type cytochrome [Acidobacteria bacterium]|nr:DmsE family decaheme c-type cytochrome [Acidobacteriota bacterium]
MRKSVEGAGHSAGSSCCAALLVLAAAISPALGADVAPAGYAGSSVCAQCHDDLAAGLSRTAHADVALPSGVTGCEACHGPGQAHADGDTEQIRRFSRLGRREASEVCLNCHQRGELTLFVGSSHDARSVGCTACHSPHRPQSSRALLKAQVEVELCASCHRQQRAALLRSSHMPLREGRLTCSSCHSPHGGVGPSNLRQVSVNENCYSCHSEKRAPRLWEHPPVRENCALCHDPHGSQHPPLLHVKLPRLCQQCHDEIGLRTTPLTSTQPGHFFPALRLFSRSCMQCHVDIHGSNHPSGSKFQR